MIVYRLSKSTFSKDLSGKGAEKCGGRWNNKGIAILYTSDSRALCTTEIAVHTPLGNIPTDYEIIIIEIPDEIKIKELSLNKLPADWMRFPHSSTTQDIGNQFIKDGINLVLKVPSAIVQGEYNYLVNPNHKDFKKIKIKSIDTFSFDERLFIK